MYYLLIFILTIILTVLIICVIKYLQYKKNVGFTKVLLIIILSNILFFGFIEIIAIINDKIDQKRHKEIMQIYLYSEDYKDSDLRKHYDSLTDEEKETFDFVDRIAKNRRNMFMYEAIPLIFVVNIFSEIVIYFLIDLIIFVAKKIKNKLVLKKYDI